LQSDQFDLHATIEDQHWWFVGRRQIINKLVNEIVAPAGVIVDIGCGTGGNLGSLADKYECIGIDASPEAIELARKRFPETKFICGMTPDDLGEINNRADLFLLLDVLEHIENDREFFQKIFGSLRPGAHILITVPADMSLWSPHDVNYGHFRRYDAEQLKRVWSGLPASLRLLSYFNTALYPVIRVVRAFNQIRNREWGDAGTDLSLPPKFINSALTSIFAREARRLVSALRGKRERIHGFGVSLVAVMQKDA
jgi:2-polyprenyl-3-methyl-5-hydroxy-6-metoxy-1,4-benzoquinol methylase